MRVAGRLAMVSLAIVASALAALAPRAAGAPSSNIVTIADLGSGARETWVFAATEPPTCVVVFLHDGVDVSPARYTAWLDYLVLGRSCAVIFPRYQLSAGGASASALEGVRAGVAAGLAHVRRAQFGLQGNRARAALPTIVAGVGHGGTLALYYAANARRWGLPVPAAIDSVFPAVGRIPGVPLPRLPAATRVLVQVGDGERLAGRAAADELRGYLATPRGRIRVVHSTAALKAVRGAPLQTTASAENAFWTPLDALIEGAR